MTHGYNNVSCIHPLNVVDPVRVATIAESMRREGWVGVPVVIVGDGDTDALTGSHRIAAAKLVGLDAVPTISAREICEEDGLDWDQIVADANDECVNRCATAYELAYALRTAASLELCQKYGLDAI